MHGCQTHSSPVQLGPERLGEGAHPRLGGRVDRLSRHREDPKHAGQVDDVRALGLEKLGKEELAAVDHSHQIDLQKPLGIVDRVVCEHRADTDTGIVDQDIHAAVLGHHLVGQSLHAPPLSDIRHMTAHTLP